MTVTRSILLFVLAALAEIGGAWLIWQGVREHRGWLLSLIHISEPTRLGMISYAVRSLRGAALSPSGART